MVLCSPAGLFLVGFVLPSFSTHAYFRHELGNPRYSYHAVTSLGKRVLHSIVEVLIPPASVLPSERQERKVILGKT